MPFVIRGDEAEIDSPVGGKARSLVALARAGLSVPPWFALTPDACRALRGNTPPCPAWVHEIQVAISQLCPDGELLAVRSSATDEDGVHHSFAGQLDSYLNVPAKEVTARVGDVWRSAFSERVVAYRRWHHLSLPPPAPAVLIQRMIHADAAGVAFGADPVSGRRDLAVISAVRGLGSALALGEAGGETYHVDRDSRNVKRVTVADSAGALSDDQARNIAELAWRANDIFGRPQDVEWAIEKGRLYVLQSRPITTLADDSAPREPRTLWDNSNIAESYSGVTTPLTFSFARRAYEHVYRRFCRLLLVPEAKLAANDDVFRNMLGLIRGRVYYNLTNWYRALALLPGFRFNRRFMEQMMGVREGLPDDIAAEISSTSRWQRWRDGWHFLGSAATLLAAHFTLPQRTQRFYQRLNKALGTTPPALEKMNFQELLRYYRNLEKQLLPNWDAPLVNDFLAMIFYGVLRRLTEKCGASAAASSHHDLLCGEGGVISAAPAKWIRRLADAARTDAELTAALCDRSLPEILPIMERRPEFREEVQAYLDKFGDRCLEELKLESPTLHDDPLLLLRSIGQLARHPARNDVQQEKRDLERRRQAERRMREALGSQPLRLALSRWVLQNARGRLRDRENLRFERTRLFGRARRIFVELGRRLHTQDRLDDPRDIFYLNVDELLALAETASPADLRALVQPRKLEFERYRQTPPPPDRFATYGPTHEIEFEPVAARPALPDAEQRRGLGCSPGIAHGPVCVVTDPRDPKTPAGRILVAQRTDPGWITLFAGAAGLVVERGSPLSHAAIVARELGLAMVVGVEGVTRWLQDWDEVEIDGSHGTVTRIAQSERGK